MALAQSGNDLSTIEQQLEIQRRVQLLQAQIEQARLELQSEELQLEIGRVRQERSCLADSNAPGCQEEDQLGSLLQQMGVPSSAIPTDGSAEDLMSVLRAAQSESREAEQPSIEAPEVALPNFGELSQVFSIPVADSGEVGPDPVELLPPVELAQEPSSSPLNSPGFIEPQGIPVVYQIRGSTLGLEAEILMPAGGYVRAFPGTELGNGRVVREILPYGVIVEGADGAVAQLPFGTEAIRFQQVVEQPSDPLADLFAANGNQAIPLGGTLGQPF